MSIRQISTARAFDFHPKHNLYCIREENYPYIEPFKRVIPFLKERKICKALTEKHECYESHVRMFWSSARYDEKEETIYSAVKMNDDKKKDIDLEVKFTMVDIRRVLDLQDKDGDPIIILERMCKGFWLRMGPYKFLVHCDVHALSHRKGAYNETSSYIMNIIACLVLNRPYNISQVIFNHMVDNVKGEKYIMYPRFIQILLDDQRLDKYKGVKPENKPKYRAKFSKIKKENYMAPEGDQWRHADNNSEDEIDRLKDMVQKKLRFWYERNEKKRKRT
ncbi:hypothetical protein Hanom_Chr10g00925601 [Helianthus anomalus]